MKILASVSLTTRVAIAAFVATAVPIVVAYAAVATIPQRLAGDAVSLDLRTVAQNATTTIRTRRLALRERIATRAADQRFRRAVLRRDGNMVSSLVGASRVEFLSGAHTEPIDSPISGRAIVEGLRGEIVTVIAIEQLDRQTLSAAHAGLSRSLRLPIAMVSDRRVTASSPNFPAGFGPRDIERLRQAPRREIDIRTASGPLPVYSRHLGLDGDADVVVAATRELVDSHIQDRREQLLLAMLSLAIAGLLFSVLAAVIVNRGLRPVGRATEALAGGDFSARLPIAGNDGFARISRGYNDLAARLRSTIGDMRNVLETIDQGVCLWAEDGGIALWNRGAESITGVGRSELQQGCDVERALRLHASPGASRVALPVTRDGRPVIVDLTTSRMRDGGLLQAFVDVTAHDELERIRRNFVATASHELRTPLTTILGCSDTLLNPHVQLSDAQRAEFLRLIHGEAQTLGRLIDSFFQSSVHFDDGVVALELGPLDVADVVSEGVARGTAAASTEVGAAQVAVDVVDGLTAVANAGALTTVVAHVVDNALKYGALPVSVSAHSDGGWVEIVVKDGGTIEPHHLPHVFDPFYRVDANMLHGVGGAGLGLFVSRRMVEAMHGTIGIESSRDGTAVRIRIERDRSTSEPESHQSPSSPWKHAAKS